MIDTDGLFRLGLGRQLRGIKLKGGVGFLLENSTRTVRNLMAADIKEIWFSFSAARLRIFSKIYLLKSFTGYVGRLLNHFLSKLALICIGVYQVSLGVFLGGNCRFFPSCSEYSRECFEKHRFGYAVYLTIKRLGRCVPLIGGEGFDPVPCDCQQVHRSNYTN